MSKYLYTNGCSFTAGHELELDDTWPFKLGELFKRKVINKAVNGNSMFAIAHTTFHHLQFLPPEDTIVVIGMTWEGRNGVLFDNTTINLTSQDIGKKEPYYGDKISNHRRSCPVHDLDLNNKIKNKLFSDYVDNPKLTETITPYTEGIKQSIKNDPYYLRNTQLEYKYHYSMLENYLQNKGYKYLFVDFQGYYYPENFVTFTIESNPTCHPTAKDCTKIANFIHNKLTNE
jgi:hypothetical protein